ncbi:DUF2147 domain-containing protein [Limibacter armeniacum]|uniref:DUF2147 domain-containing protein n=1 Tax=Limibacter armeniacum TaxID=466084 RepID=UPI002FE60542
MFKQLLLTITLLLAGTAAIQAQSVMGKWKTIDEETGEAKSIVEIYEKNGKVFGKIVKLLNKPADTLCDECPGDRKNQPIVGMNIITDMEKKGKEYAEGEIMDPANGKVYDCKLWTENGKLMVRGYVAFFFRTQEWVKAEDM